MEPALNTQRLTVGTHVAVWCITGCALTILAALSAAYDDANIWGHWKPAEELFRGLYAEPIHESSILRTQVNTWSNAAFLLTGLYIFALGVADWRSRSRTNFLGAHPAFSFAYSAACIGLAIGSAFFHASLTRWGQHADVAMMYAPPLVLVALNTARYGHRSIASRLRPLEASVVLAASAWLVLTIFKWSVSSVVVLSILIGALMVFAVADSLDRRVSARPRLIVLAGAAFIAGLVFQWLDIARIVTEGHALWHVCSAAALWWAYHYHRSETTIYSGTSEFVETAESDNLVPDLPIRT